MDKIFLDLFERTEFRAIDIDDMVDDPSFVAYYQCSENIRLFFATLDTIKIVGHIDSDVKSLKKRIQRLSSFPSISLNAAQREQIVALKLMRQL